MKTFAVTVFIECENAEQAHTILDARLNGDEDLREDGVGEYAIYADLDLRELD